MSLQAGHKIFPQLGPKIQVCKSCAGTHRLEFSGLAYLDADIKHPDFCPICGGFKPLFQVRNKRRGPGSKAKEGEDAHKARRKQGWK